MPDEKKTETANLQEEKPKIQKPETDRSSLQTKDADKLDSVKKQERK